MRHGDPSGRQRVQRDYHRPQLHKQVCSLQCMGAVLSMGTIWFASCMRSSLPVERLRRARSQGRLTSSLRRDFSPASMRKQRTITLCRGRHRHGGSHRRAARRTAEHSRQARVSTVALRDSQAAHPRPLYNFPLGQRPCSWADACCVEPQGQTESVQPPRGATSSGTAAPSRSQPKHRAGRRRIPRRRAFRPLQPQDRRHRSARRTPCRPASARRTSATRTRASSA